MKVLPLLTFLLAGILSLSTTTHAASLTTDEVLVRLQEVIETEKGFEKLTADLNEMDEKSLVALLKNFDRTFPRLRDNYTSRYQNFAKSQFSGKAKTKKSKLIREYRSDFMKVYALGEGPMKPLLKTKSMPAIKGLKKLIMPEVKEIFATAPQALHDQRKLVMILAKFRDAIVEAAVLPDQTPAEKGIVSFEKETISSFAGLPRDGLRIMKKNDQIAVKGDVLPKEREGIREMNEWRLLLGLNALEIDPKLCDASRGHSEDMNKNGFFAHDSPIKGKETPWKRAAIEGTKASGENIYMGSESPGAANKGWFFSPGHHKNMFRASHKRIGLGKYSRHWTQMFG